MPLRYAARSRFNLDIDDSVWYKESMLIPDKPEPEPFHHEVTKAQKNPGVAFLLY